MLIYKCTNKITGKFYIGQTKSTLEHRRSQHLSDAKRDKSNNHFYNSIRFHGKDYFTWEVLEQNVSHINKLNWLEEFYIGYYNCLDRKFGYNSMSGGGNSIPTDDARKNISKAARKRPPVTDMARKNISNGSKGKKLSEEHKKNISTGNKGKNIGKKFPMRCGEKNTFAKAVFISGVHYGAIVTAAKKLNITAGCIYTRINSKSERFKDYQYFMEGDCT